MNAPLADPDELVALGAFAGAQVIVVIFSVIKAHAYRERSYMLHAVAAMLGVLAVQTLAGTHPFFPQSVLLLAYAAAGMQMRELISHGGALRDVRRWIVMVSIALPVLAVASAWLEWVLLVGVVAWASVASLALHRAWRQSQPWIWWLLPGMGALAAAGLLLGGYLVSRDGAPALPVAGLLALWTGCVYLATGWRGRISGVTRARIDARNTVDPLTGLAMPIVLNERIHAARLMMKRYGHPSVLLLVYIENLGRISAEYGPEAAESALLTAAIRVRQCLREGDVAARLTHSRFAVLAEGMAPPEAASNVASRLLVAGLKEPLAQLPAEFLQFRIVLAPVPEGDMPAKVLLGKLGARLEQELHSPSERRIATLTNEELNA